MDEVVGWVGAGGSSTAPLVLHWLLVAELWICSEGTPRCWADPGGEFLTVVLHQRGKLGPYSISVFYLDV